MDIMELRNAVKERIALEKELAELRARVKPMENEVRKLTIVADDEQSDVDSLTEFELKGLVLGLIGKRESRLEKEQQEARNAQSALALAKYQLEALHRQIADREEVLKKTGDVETEYCGMIESMLPGDGTLNSAALKNIKEGMAHVVRVLDLRMNIQEKYSVLKEFGKQAETLYYYGDIKVDAIGKRYNNKLHSLRELGRKFQKSLDEYIQILRDYNDSVSGVFRIELSDPWVQPGYLTQYAADAGELYTRLDSVYCWGQRVEKKIMELVGQENAYRSAFRDVLFSVHDELMKHN